MISEKRKAANRINATRSTGPTSTTGKQRSRMNSLKHGFFSGELSLNDQERIEFELIKQNIIEQLAPRTELQSLGFDRIICSYSRLRKAIKLEEATIGFELEEEVKTDAPVKKQSSIAFLRRPSDRRDVARFLIEVRQTVAESGALHLDDFKDDLIATCGEWFFGLLSKWASQNTTAILLAEHLVQHSRTFNRPLPPILTDSEKRLIIDPNQSLEAALKLLDLKISDIQEFESVHSPGEDQSSPRGSRLDLVTRYRISATREYERSLDHYLHLKQMGL